MARYPGAAWRPLAANWNAQPRLVSPDLALLHTMVGSLSGTDGYFKQSGYGGPESHFGVGHDGTVYQWQDTAHRAEANGAANARAISIETADIGTGFPKWDTRDGAAVPAWTAEQVSSIIRLLMWICETHLIPPAMIPDSRPTRRGIGWHRLGVPARSTDRVSQTGGELWSSAAGKVCPGSRRIAQIPGIVSEVARRLAAPGPTPRPTPTPTPVPVTPVPARRSPIMLDNENVPAGAHSRRFIVPTGRASGIIGKAYLSATVNGPEKGTARVFFQSDSGGISDVTWSIGFADGRSERKYAEIPDGATQVVVQTEFPQGGTLAFEITGK